MPPAADQVALLINSFKAMNDGQKAKDAVLPFININESAIKLGKGLFTNIIQALEQFDLIKARDAMFEFMDTMSAKDKDGKLWTSVKACKDAINNALDKALYPMIKLLVQQIKDLEEAEGIVEIPNLSRTSGDFDARERNARVYQQLAGVLKPWLDLLLVGSEKFETMTDKQAQQYLQKISVVNLTATVDQIINALEKKLSEAKVSGFDVVPVRNYLNDMVARIGRLIEYAQTKPGMMPTTGLIPPPPGMEGFEGPPPPTTIGRSNW